MKISKFKSTLIEWASVWVIRIIVLAGCFGISAAIEYYLGFSIKAKLDVVAVLLYGIFISLMSVVYELKKGAK